MYKFSKEKLIFVAVIINTISGVVTDLYAPSLPEVSKYFGASPYITKFTIITCIIGFSIGQFSCGWLLDAYGRKKIFLLGILGFSIVSLLSLFSNSITELLLFRFIQGLLASPASVVSRAILIDVLEGVELNIAITYVTFGWGAGYIFSPILGGYLTFYYHWQSIFYFYFIYGIILFNLVLRLLPETKRSNYKTKFNIRNIIYSYQLILKHKGFCLSTIAQGICFSSLVIYSIIGPFLVASKYTNASIIFGKTGFIVGAIYLLGLMCNRSLLGRVPSQNIISLGLLIMIMASLGFLLTMLFFSNVELYIMIIFISSIVFSISLVFPNVAASSMKIFPNNAATAVAIQNSLILGITGLSTMCISLLKLNLTFSLPLYYFLVTGVILFLISTINKLEVSQ